MSGCRLDSVCGMRCGDCKYLGNGCKGCEGEKGAPFWTGFVGIKVCPVYDCCRDRHHEHCGCCAEMPCEKFTRFRDPEVTDEQVARSLETQKAELIRRAASRRD